MGKNVDANDKDIVISYIGTSSYKSIRVTEQSKRKWVKDINKQFMEEMCFCKTKAL